MDGLEPKSQGRATIERRKRQDPAALRYQGHNSIPEEGDMNKKWIAVLTIVGFCWTGFTGVGLAQMKGKHGSGKMGGCKMCGMKGGGMMGQGMMHGGMHHGRGPGKMRGAMCRHDLSDAFHRWLKRLMTHRNRLNLMPEQMERIQSLSVEHTKNAIRNRAEYRILMVDLRHSMGQTAFDSKSVEALLKQQGDLDLKLQLEGLATYTAVMEGFSEDQRQQVAEMVGPIMPSHWDMMSGHHGRGGMGAHSSDMPEPAESGGGDS